MANTYGVSKKQTKKVTVLFNSQITRNEMHTTAFSVNLIYSPGKIKLGAVVAHQWEQWWLIGGDTRL
jgi:hypothetical protein